MDTSRESVHPDESSLSSMEEAREILVDRLSLHIGLVLRTPIVQSLVSITYVVINAGYVEPWLLYSLSAATAAGEGIRALIAIWVRPRLNQLNLEWTHGMFVALAIINGLLNGSTAIAFFPSIPALNQAYLIIIYLGMISAGLAHASASKLMSAAYTASILVAANIGWARTYPEFALYGLIFSTIAGAYTIFITRDDEQLLSRSVSIRRERDRAMQDVQRRNEDVREAMNRAEQAASSRSRVLAAASHDLRQPMQALSMYSAMLAENPGPGTLKEVSHNIHQIVLALGNLLDGLLDLSRLSTGHYAPDLKVFRVDSIVQRLCLEYQPRAAEKGLILDAHLMPVRLHGDAMAIGRVTRNLLDNAIKYTPSGTIRVTLAIVDNQAVLSVKDTGVGIAESEQARIFEEFYQVDNPGRDRGKGVGLGLAIVQRLCELIQAKVRVVSTLGQGALFEVTLTDAINDETNEPKIKEQAISSSQNNAIEHSANPEPTTSVRRQPGQNAPLLTGRRLYVVDDEIDIRHGMQALLSRWGAEVQVAGSVGAAESLFARDGRPDLLITDLRLNTNEHGAAMASRMRDVHGHFAVLVMTGETSSDALREAKASGYTLLKKPIPIDRLRQVIDDLLNTPPA